MESSLFCIVFLSMICSIESGGGRKEVGSSSRGESAVKKYLFSRSANTHGWLVELGTVSGNGQCKVSRGSVGILVNVNNGGLETVLTTARNAVNDHRPVCARFAWGATAPVIDMTPHEEYGKSRYHRDVPSNADDIAVIRIEVSEEIKRMLIRLSLPHSNTLLELNGYIATLKGGTIEEESVTVFDQQTFTDHLISVNSEFDYAATVWFCIPGEFAFNAYPGSPYYVKRSNNAGVLYGLHLMDTPAHGSAFQARQADNGAVFVDITKYLQWIITTANGPIGQGHSMVTGPAKYIKEGNTVHDPDTGKSWQVQFYYGDPDYTCNQDVTHLMKIGDCFHNPDDPRCYWTIYNPSG